MIRRRAGTIPKSLESKLEEGDYYEALQLYKSLQSRYEGNNKYKESDELLFHGIENLNKHEQTIGAYDLAIIYFNCLKKRDLQFSVEIGDSFIKILDTFPECSEKEKLLTGFTSWCTTTGNSLVGYPRLNDYAGKYYWGKKEYEKSNDYYLLSENMQDFADMVLEWSEKGYNSEIDLFVLRPVLILCSKQNLRDAIIFFNRVCDKKKDDEEFNDLPLVHFGDFLLQTLQRDAAPLFSMLREKYNSEIERDTKFDVYLDKIGEVFFNIRKQNDLFSNMLRMFGGQ